MLQYEIGHGDDIFLVGLFAQHPGANRVLPILRFGNISLMPYEAVRITLEPEFNSITTLEAYLIECKSWGGHSGSPVFFYHSPDRYMMQGGLTIVEAAPVVLGLVAGHFDIDQEVKFLGDIWGSGKVPLNSGISVVVPAQYIIDTIAAYEK